MYTTAMAFLDALHEAGVSCIFANFGSDHAAIIESLAKAGEEQRDLPRVIVCPHETVALSAAHGYAQASGEPQAVIIHVDVGTQNLGGAIHNASRGRIPVLIFAGASPYTQEGELPGSRNEHILWLQDVFDQRGIVREYVKYSNEIRTGKNVKQLVHRAMQFANSAPRGPVYLVAPREVLEEPAEDVAFDPTVWQPIAPAAIAAEDLAALAGALAAARHPLIVTSYVGINPRAVDSLVNLAEHLAAPVLESVPNYMNFPSTHPLHAGYQWNEPVQNEWLAQADVILVIDSDIPWIPTVNKPRPDCVVYSIDVDPLKEKMPLWYIPARRSFKADAEVALRQLNDYFATHAGEVDKQVETRRQTVANRHRDRQAIQHRLEQPAGRRITPEYLTACVRRIVDDDTIVLNEGVSNYGVISRHLGSVGKGRLFASGTSSLGWNGGAALGVKLARPGQKVISLTGDGSYLFSVPASVHWAAERYGIPFLTVIYNNSGWKSPKLSTLGVHPDGAARRTNMFGVEFPKSARLADIAKASGAALALTVDDPEALEPALQQGLETIIAGKCAVIDVRLETIAEQRGA